MVGEGREVKHKDCEQYCQTWFFVYEYFLTAYFALAIILLYGRKDAAVSRICAPVKMQINLFVRNTCAF